MSGTSHSASMPKLVKEGEGMTGREASPVPIPSSTGFTHHLFLIGSFPSVMGASQNTHMSGNELAWAGMAHSPKSCGPPSLRLTASLPHCHTVYHCIPLIMHQMLVLCTLQMDRSHLLSSATAPTSLSGQRPRRVTMKPLRT